MRFPGGKHVLLFVLVFVVSFSLMFRPSRSPNSKQQRRSGKTESVKALGGQFGRQVLVFNCDEVRREEGRGGERQELPTH